MKAKYILAQGNLASTKALHHLMGNIDGPFMLLAVKLLLDSCLPGHVHHRLDVVWRGKAPGFRANDSHEHCFEILVHEYRATKAACEYGSTEQLDSASERPCCNTPGMEIDTLALRALLYFHRLNFFNLVADQVLEISNRQYVGAIMARGHPEWESTNSCSPAAVNDSNAIASLAGC
jgi:hypothetical protein